MKDAISRVSLSAVLLLTAGSLWAQEEICKQIPQEKSAAKTETPPAARTGAGESEVCKKTDQAPPADSKPAADDAGKRVLDALKRLAEEAAKASDSSIVNPPQASTPTVKSDSPPPVMVPAREDADRNPDGKDFFDRR